MTFHCDACGADVAAERMLDSRLRCPNFGTRDGDHVLRPKFDRVEFQFPPPIELQKAKFDPIEFQSLHTANPFVRYRHLLTARDVAAQFGWNDEQFVALVNELDAEVARVDGRGFRETPLVEADRLARALGLGDATRVWVKDETVNVSGSHKGRHLAGVMLYLQVLSRAGARETPRLAVASCGNAALAAAVVARAGHRPLDVFVPPSANPGVVGRLHELDAQVVTCERRHGERGDPCYLRFSERVSAGALPFCCQGSDNALTVEGGASLTWEVLDRLRESPPHRVFVQVGGGAFAAACARAWDAAARAGLIARRPRLHPVQTAGGFPLARAWAAVAARALEAMLLESEGFEFAVPGEVVGFGAREVMSALQALAGARGDDEASIARAVSVDHRALRACAEALASDVCLGEARQVLSEAARERSSFMWPWEREPRSRAHGILDDETYDWREVLEGTIASGGWPIVVGEEQVERANRVGREATGIDADHTGTAGLAGLLALTDAGPAVDPLIPPAERILLVFSGVRRDPR